MGYILTYRFYMGRHKVVIMEKQERKALIMHLEKGHVGNMKTTYRKVEEFDRDIVPMRTLWVKRKRKGNK